jgi:hypothetical protein
MLNEAMDTAVVRSHPSAVWDYQVKSFHARNIVSLEDTLKEEGKQGWELVFMDTLTACEYLCIFRKMLS